MNKRLWLAAAFLCALAVPAAAQQQTALRVHIPDGIRAGFVTTDTSTKPGMKYLVVPDISIVNHTNGVVSYNVKDFSLITSAKTYHPVGRPHLSAVDITTGGVLGPHDTLRGNLAFLVPDDIYAGNLEFRPNNWYNLGQPVIYCCLP